MRCNATALCDQNATLTAYGLIRNLRSAAAAWGSSTARRAAGAGTDAWRIIPRCDSGRVVRPVSRVDPSRVWGGEGRAFTNSRKAAGDSNSGRGHAWRRSTLADRRNPRAVVGDAPGRRQHCARQPRRSHRGSIVGLPSSRSRRPFRARVGRLDRVGGDLHPTGRPASRGRPDPARRIAGPWPRPPEPSQRRHRPSVGQRRRSTRRGARGPPRASSRRARSATSRTGSRRSRTAARVGSCARADSQP